MSRDLLLISIAMFTWGIGDGLFIFFQPLYLEELGADPIMIGTILGGFGLAMTISHIPAGYLADRIGRKPVLVAGWFTGVVSAWIMAFADILPVFVIGLILYGLTLFVMSPLQSYLTAARGNFSVGRVITLMSASYNLGAVIGPMLGGRIGDQFGLRQTYIVAGAIFLVSLIVLVFIRSQPVEHPLTSDMGKRWFYSPRYLVYMLVIFLSMFAMFLPQPLTPNFLSNQGGYDLSQIGLLFSVSSVGVVVLNLVLGALPTLTGFLLGQAAVAVFTLILWWANGYVWFLFGFFMLGGFRTARNLGMAQVRELVPSAKMGLAYGVSETVSATTVILAPIAAGFLYTQNPVIVYAIGFGLLIVSIIFSAKYSPKPGDRSVEATLGGVSKESSTSITDG
ncbi:MAG: MFS transporter [Chloroflexota bacterium]|nr:MAG: MFS transporter [Chloroflexota bacterium]